VGISSSIRPTSCAQTSNASSGFGGCAAIWANRSRLRSSQPLSDSFSFSQDGLVFRLEFGAMIFDIGHGVCDLPIGQLKTVEDQLGRSASGHIIHQIVECYTCPGDCQAALSSHDGWASRPSRCHRFPSSLLANSYQLYYHPLLHILHRHHLPPRPQILRQSLHRRLAQRRPISLGLRRVDRRADQEAHLVGRQEPAGQP